MNTNRKAKKDDASPARDVKTGKGASVEIPSTGRSTGVGTENVGEAQSRDAERAIDRALGRVPPG